MDSPEVPSRSRLWVGVAAIVASALLPVLRILANNVGEGLSVVRLGTWFVGFVAAGLLLLWLAVRLDPPDSQRLQAAVVVAHLAVLMYGIVLSRALHVVDIWGKLGVTAAIVIAGWLLARWATLQRFFLLLPMFLLVAPIVDLVTSGSRAEAAPVKLSSEISLPRLPSGAGRNVYWFILDGYGRWDVMEAMGGQFNLGGELSALGFQIDNKAVAPYEYTDLSVGATLTMAYLPDLATFKDLRVHARPILEGNPSVVAWFAREGYRMLHLPGAGWPDWPCGQPRSICLLDSPVHLEDDMFHTVTILGTILDLLDGNQEHRLDRRVDPVPAIETSLRIQSLDRVKGRRTLSVIHVMSSHPDFRWLGTRCEPQPAGLLTDRWLPIENYLDAARCTGQRTLEAVRLIVAEDPDAIVIVQGDHGPRLLAADWNSSETDISVETVWMGVLLAMKLPDGCALGEGNNTVNVFRVVIGCLGGSPIDRLDSRSWHMDPVGSDWKTWAPVAVRPDNG